MNPELMWMAAFFGFGPWSACKVGATDSGAVARKCGKPDAIGRDADIRGLCGRGQAGRSPVDDPNL